jgi:hypothetical protein
MPQARTTGTATMIQLATGEQLLVVEIAIACDHCGTHTVRFAGHHLRAIRDLLIEFIDLHPGLTGQDSDTRTIERLQLGGRVGDPTQN